MTNNCQTKMKKMKKRNMMMSSTLMLGFLCIAFTFDKQGIHWLWKDSKIVAVILIIATIIFGVLWFKSTQKQKLERSK